MLSEFQDDVTVRKQDEIDKTHNITKSDLNQAVSTLGAFLSVREVFYRIANDLEVTRYCFYDTCKILHKECYKPLQGK